MPGDRAWVIAWLAVALGCVVGCASAPPDPPTAVIVATPRYSCAGDDFATPVTLSAATSSARISLSPSPPDPGAPPLLFDWALSGDEHVIIDGGLALEEVVVVLAGERPLSVELAVDDQLGGIAQAVFAVGLTFPTECADGCPTGQTCEAHAEASYCVPDTTCMADDDCPACLSCDATLGRCLWETR